MKVVEMAKNIYFLGSNIKNEKLFEGLWPIEDGVTLNSYLIKGDKTVLIDLKREWGGATDVLQEQLKNLCIDIADLDYVVLNHLEPDHTGWLREFSQKNPQITYFMTKKAKPVAQAFFGLDEKFIHTIEDGESLDLGQGRELVFYETPNIHWPETMMSYEKNEQILFACDAFGSFGALTDAVFDDQISSELQEMYDRETLRYYSNIVSSFSTFVERGIKKLADLPIKVIAPSHGLIWRENPTAIVEKYVKLASYASGKAEPEITLIWGSMYGHTKEVVYKVIEGIRSENVPVHVHQVPDENLSHILASAWKSTGLVFGMPTYEYKMFPAMAQVIDMFERKHVFNRKVFRFGAWGWSGGAQKEFDSMTEKFKWECLDPVEWQGKANCDVCDTAKERGIQLARKVKEACK